MRYTTWKSYWRLQNTSITVDRKGLGGTNHSRKRLLHFSLDGRLQSPKQNLCLESSSNERLTWMV